MSESPERTGPQRRGPKRRVTLSLAVIGAVVALIAGIVIGYAARGGPPEGVLVTTQQEIPVVTVTTEELPP